MGRAKPYLLTGLRKAVDEDIDSRVNVHPLWVETVSVYRVTDPLGSPC